MERGSLPSRGPQRGAQQGKACRAARPRTPLTSGKLGRRGRGGPEALFAFCQFLWPENQSVLIATAATVCYFISFRAEPSEVLKDNGWVDGDNHPKPRSDSLTRHHLSHNETLHLPFMTSGKWQWEHRREVKGSASPLVGRAGTGTQACLQVLSWSTN